MDHDRIQVAEIVCWNGVAHMDGDPAVDAMFVVEQFDEVGSQIGAKFIAGKNSDLHNVWH